MKLKTQQNLWLILTVIIGLIGCLGWAAMVGVGLHYHPKPPLQAALRYFLWVGPLFAPIPLLMWMRFSGSAKFKSVFYWILTLAGGALAAFMLFQMIRDGGDAGIWLFYLVYGSLIVWTARILRKTD